MDITQLNPHDLAQKLASKELSSEEITKAFLEKIKRQDIFFHAFLEVYEDAVEQARQIDTLRKKGASLDAFAGLPIAVKNNILVQGKKTTSGSFLLKEYVASYSATVIKRIQQAGLILIGATNMDEFAMGSSTENSYFGPTKNPWDPTKVPGGTSGGSAAAVASRMVPLALGSDTGGSVRQPASLCGITGLKPTYGRVSRYGLMATASSLDQIGTFAPDVLSAAHLLRLIEGKDEKDATSAELSETTIEELLEPEIQNMRIGIPKEYFLEGMDPEIKKAILESVKLLEQQGAQIKELSLPHTDYALAAYYLILFSEASSNLARFDGIRYGFSPSVKNIQEAYELARGQGFGPEVKRRIMLGTYTLSKGYYEAYYKKALQARTLIKKDFDEAFKEVDVLITPTSPCVAWGLGEKFEDPLAMYLADIYTISISLATVPALSVPCGFSKNLPVGMQIIARPFNEHALLRVAAFYQSITDWHKKIPANVL